MKATFAERRRIARRHIEDDQVMDVGLVDQVLAAERDIRQQAFLPVAAGLLATQTMQPAHPSGLAEIRASQELLIAAGLDCRPCAHIRRSAGPVPVWVLLGFGVAVCARCMQTQRSRPEPGTEDRCDVCGSRGHEDFSEFVCQFGNAMYIGNAAPCCAPTLTGVAAT